MRERHERTDQPRHYKIERKIGDDLTPEQRLELLRLEPDIMPPSKADNLIQYLANIAE